MNLTWIDYLLPEAKNLWSRKEEKRNEFRAPATPARCRNGTRGYGYS